MKSVPVKPIVFLASIAFMGSAGISTASAAGYLTGAAVGGVAGHMAGHGVVGAAADQQPSQKAQPSGPPPNQQPN